MNRGRRYEERKLNLKKVFAVFIAIVVLIMFIFIIKGILTKDREQGKIVSTDYFVSYQNNKWGVINSKAENIIDPSYAEMIIIPNSKKDVFICTYDVNYETGEYKTKVLNNKNEEIFTNYNKIEAIPNNDEGNNLWYEENVLKVEKDGKYGLIDLNGKELVACEYEEITAVKGIKNALKTKKDGKQGVITDDGKVLLKPQYNEIEALGKDNKSGFIIQAETGKYGIVDYSANSILSTNYDEISKIYGNDYYVVKKNNKQILVKKGDEEVLTSGFNEIKQVLKTSEGQVIFTINNLYGVMKTTGEVLIEPTYEELKEAKSGILIAKLNGKYAIMDINKNNKTDYKYTDIFYNEKADIYTATDETLNNEILDNTFTVRQTGIVTDEDDEKGYIKIKQGDEYKFYNFKFEEKAEKDIYSSNTLYISKNEGKYGFVDKEGKVVVDYTYDDVTEQNAYGYAGIKKDGKWGVIDEKGNVIQEPIYNLEEHLKIDFVGRWHLGKDINMNYYCQQ